jgi:hypothetical protein
LPRHKTTPVIQWSISWSSISDTEEFSIGSHVLAELVEGLNRRIRENSSGHRIFGRKKIIGNVCGWTGIDHSLEFVRRLVTTLDNCSLLVEDSRGLSGELSLTTSIVVVIAIATIILIRTIACTGHG